MTYCEASPGLQDDAVADAAIFEMLQHNISDNYGRLVQEWQRGSIPIASSEAVDATISPDGNVMTYKFARLIPFDVVTVMDTAWRSGQSDFHDGMSRTVRRFLSFSVSSEESLRVVAGVSAESG